jgi:outer membrane lipoprotein-sorting protein
LILLVCHKDMIILIALTIWLQEGTAEESYRRIEETLEKAKSLSVNYKIELATGDLKMTGSGTILLKEGNRLKVTLSSGGAGIAKLDASSVSDGSTIRSLPKRPGSTETEWVTPKTLNERVTVALLRSGCFELHRLPGRMRGYDTNPKESLVISDLRRGDDDSGLRTLVYTLQEGSGRGEMRVWIDPNTWLLRKRVFTIPAQGRQPPSTVTETYETFAVNSEIPNDVFKLTDK